MVEPEEREQVMEVEERVAELFRARRAEEGSLGSPLLEGLV